VLFESLDLWFEKAMGYCFDAVLVVQLGV